MICRSLVFTLLLVGLTVASPTGPLPSGGQYGTQGGNGEEIIISSSGTTPGTIGSTGGFQGGTAWVVPSSSVGSFSYDQPPSGNSSPVPFTSSVSASSHQNQYPQQFQYAFAADGQKRDVEDQQNKVQVQTSSQGTYKTQDDSSRQQLQGSDSQNQAFLQGYQAFLQQNQPYLQMYQAYLQQQQSRNPSYSVYPQQNTWTQSARGQQEQQGGGRVGYGYSSSPSSATSYTGSGASGMSYLPGMYNHASTGVSASHDFTPFSSGYSGGSLGTGSYGVPQAYNGKTYQQGTYGTQSSQGYVVVPVSSLQGQLHYSQDQVSPNTQGVQMYEYNNPMSSMQSQSSNQKTTQAQAQ